MKISPEVYTISLVCLHVIACIPFTELVSEVGNKIVKELVEAGFEYVTAIEDAQMFRKRK